MKFNYFYGGHVAMDDRGLAGRWMSTSPRSLPTWSPLRLAEGRFRFGIGREVLPQFAEAS